MRERERQAGRQSKREGGGEEEREKEREGEKERGGKCISGTDLLTVLRAATLR